MANSPNSTGHKRAGAIFGHDPVRKGWGKRAVNRVWRRRDKRLARRFGQERKGKDR